MVIKTIKVFWQRISTSDQLDGIPGSGNALVVSVL